MTRGQGGWQGWVALLLFYAGSGLFIVAMRRITDDWTWMTLMLAVAAILGAFMVATREDER